MSASSSAIRQHVVLRVEGDSRFAVCRASVDALCAQSDYVRSLARGGFVEAQRAGKQIDVVLPAGLLTGAALDHLAETIAQDSNSAVDFAVAVLLWRALDFLRFDKACDRARQAINMALNIWACATDQPTAVDVDPAVLIHLYAVRVRTADTDGVPQPPDPRETLFLPRAIWHCGECPSKPRDGSPCSLHLKRVRPFLALGQKLIQAAATALAESMGRDPRSLLVESVEVLSRATTEALSDWHACVAAIDKHLEHRHPLGLCDVFASPLAHLLVVAQNSHNNGTPCFVPSVESFRSALLKDFPRLAPVILDRGWLDDCVALAGGSVVNAMQSEPLRLRQPYSDLDLWVTGRSRRLRKRTFKRIVRHIFDRVPGCRGKINEGCAIVLYPPGVHDTTARDDGSALAIDRTESIQVVLTDYNHLDEIVSEFDLHHSCALFDGYNVRASWGCLASMVSRTTQSVPGAEIRPSRVDKARRKGFDFVDTPRDCDESNDDENNGIPLVDVGNHYGRERDVVCRPAKRPRTQDHYYDNPDDLLRAFCFAPLVTGSACSSVCRPRPTQIGSTRIIWARDPVFVRIPPLQVISSCCVRCAMDPKRSETEHAAGCTHTPPGLAIDLDDSNYGAASDIVEAERTLFAMVTAKSGIFFDASTRDTMPNAACTSAAAVAKTLADAWTPLIFRTASITTMPFGTVRPGRARVHLQFDTETEARDAVTGRRLDPRLIPVGSYVSARLVADRVVVSCGFNPRLRALTLCVYPPTFHRVMSAAMHV